MTSERPDTERAVRQWLAETAPDQAPASLREALEREVVRPAGHARPWPRLGHDGLRFAGRIAAALAILAIAGTGAYFYGTSRAKAPGAAVSASPTTSSDLSPQPTSSTGTGQLVGDWHLVDTSFLDDQPGAFQTGHLTQIASLASGGFVAFIYDSKFDETVVYRSGDGTTWDQAGTLPTQYATLTSVVESGGRVVAVGYASDSTALHATPMAWSSTDLHSWQAAVLPAPADTDATTLTAGPAGLLAVGYGISQSATSEVSFWRSSDGTSWQAVTPKGISMSGGIEDLNSSSAGYVARTADGKVHTWQSADGLTWTEAWTTGTADATEFYPMGGYDLPAPGGGFVTFAAGAPDFALWTSTDLTHWTEAGRLKSYGGTVSEFGSLPGGYVAAGLCDVNVPNCPHGLLGIWTSTDGLWWQLVPGITPLVDQSQNLMINSVITDGSHAIVVMRDESDRIHLLVGTERK